MSDVKVGDVVKDPALLEVGMVVSAYSAVWTLTERLPESDGRGWVMFSEEMGRGTMLDRYLSWWSMQRILALPPKAEVPPCVADAHRLLEITREFAPVPKCSPGCTPATPCRTDGVCPVFAEEVADEGMREDFHANGLVPEGLYEPRPTRFLPLHHAGNGGFAIWGRR